jgi:hypothetical protein
VASKRVQRAINILTGASSSSEDLLAVDGSSSIGAKRGRPKKTRAKPAREDDGDFDEDDEFFEGLVMNEDGSLELARSADDGPGDQSEVGAGRDGGGARRRAPRRPRAAAQPSKPKDPLVLAAQNKADPIRARIAAHLIESSSKKKVSLVSCSFPCFHDL